MPASVDLGPVFQQRGLAPRAQGSRNTCSLFAITALADFEYQQTAQESRPRLSEEFLIWAANEATGRVGDQAMFYEAIQGLNALGICPDESFAYSREPDPKQIPSEKNLADARELSHRWRVEWLKRWDVREPLTPEELLSIKRALADGHPVACGLRWPKSQRGPDLLEVPPADGVYDGHSIVFTGYADDASQPGGGAFLFRNSYGPRWGKDGYGRISFGYATAYANDALFLHCGKPGSETPAKRYEAESLTILASEKCRVSSQNMNDYGGPMWSNGEQLYCRAASGGSVDLSFEVEKPGRYRVRLLATAGPNYGQIQVGLDGQRLDPVFDLYSGRISPAGSLELGTHDLIAGKHTLRVQSEHKHAASNGYRFGLDTIDLIAVE